VSDSRETNSPQGAAPRRIVGTKRFREAMPKPISTRIFTVANQKGGVGKTTSAVNIGAALAMGGLRTLIIDLDPQGNASTAFGISRDEVNGMYEVITKDLPIVEASLKVPGYVQRGERIDYVIIDCPPSLGLLTINALVAADELLIPIQCEYYSLEGLTLLLHTVSLIQEHLNQNIKLSTIVLTMYDGRTRLANDVADEVRKHYPEQLIDIPIPRAVRVSEAPSYGQTVMTYDPSSNGAEAYGLVAREIARRGAPTINSTMNNTSEVSAG